MLVALGGGRVIDVAKALAAADPPRKVAAIPTTLSGAEMTAIHRQALGAPPGSRSVRPAIVINDPALSASQPVVQLAQSGGNAFGHAVEGPVTPLSNPIAALAAISGARLLQSGFATPNPDDDARDRLALGALLAAYVIGAGAVRRGVLSLGDLDQNDRVDHERDRERDRPAIQVALDQRAAAERTRAGADAEGA
jgi:alcohol dehydrogenase class IV